MQEYESAASHCAELEKQPTFFTLRARPGASGVIKGADIPLPLL